MANYGLAKVHDVLGFGQELVAGGVTLTFATGPNRIIRSSGSWFASNPWATGMVADVSGTVSNDGRYTVTAVSALELEVAEAVVAEGPLNSGEKVVGGFMPIFGVVRNGSFVDNEGPINIPPSVPGTSPGNGAGAGVYQWQRPASAPHVFQGMFTSYLAPTGIVLCLIVGHMVLESTDDGATWSVALSLSTLSFDTDHQCSPFCWVTGSDGKPYLVTTKQSRGEGVYYFARRDDSGWVTDTVANASVGTGMETFAYKGLLFAGTQYGGNSFMYTYDPVTRSITSLPAPPKVAGTPQSFFFTLGQRLFRVQSNSAGVGNGIGSIATVDKVNYTDGQTFTLIDNFRPPQSVTFEFDVTGDGVTPGNVAVNISALTTADQVRNAIINAVDAVGYDLLIDATSIGGGLLRVTQDAGGVGGRTQIATTGSPPGAFNEFLVTAGSTMPLIEFQFGVWVLVEEDFLPQLNTQNSTIRRSYATFKLDDDSVLVFGQGDRTGIGSIFEPGLECWRIYLSGGVPTVERKTDSVVPVALRYPTTIGDPTQYLLSGYTDNTDPENPRRFLWFYPANATADLQWTKMELDPVDPANNPMTVLETTQIVDGWSLPSSYAGDGHQIWSPTGEFAIQILEQVKDTLGVRIYYRVANDPGNPNKTVKFFNDDLLGRPGVNGQCTLVAGSAVGGGTVVDLSGIGAGPWEIQGVDADPSIVHEVIWNILADGVTNGSYPHLQAVATRP